MKSQKNERLEWFLSAVAGLFVSGLIIASGVDFTQGVSLWLVLPFILLLLSIAITPLINPAWWHSNYPDVALFLGSLVAGLYAFAIPGGLNKLAHAGHEYFAFLALIGGLFFVVSCIELEVDGKANSLLNCLLLLFGAVISNVLGTTGASLLLIRPFIKLNKGRMRPLHIVFFIIIVSNCGGSLTPIGDPPLYLGYLKGVPFSWTFDQLLNSWMILIGSLLIIFWFYDKFFVKPVESHKQKLKFRIRGTAGLVSLFLMIAAIFIDPMLSDIKELKGLPMTALAQVIIATSCFLMTNQRIKHANEFTFEPFKEVALIFAGIFATMIPALEYLSIHGQSLGIHSAKSYFFFTGIMSAFLDNAPTYLNFLQVAVSQAAGAPTEISKQAIEQLISNPEGNTILLAISSGAVFFGALTYIGNGPNFMVRSIALSMKVRAPSFFSYIASACLLLLPLLLLISWLKF